VVEKKVEAAREATMLIGLIEKIEADTTIDSSLKTQFVDDAYIELTKILKKFIGG